MEKLKLVIANKNYSSWSLRPWLAMRIADLDFDEILILLEQDDTRDNILAYSPAGRVPVLIDGDITIWESLAILEYLAEKFPDSGMWPEAAEQRALARAVSSEMHAGFPGLRGHYPMNIRKRIPGRRPTPEAAADIDRIKAIWGGCLERYGGPFLFGAFCNADAMFAPVVSRFETYGIEVSRECRAYMDDILTLPAFEQWSAAAEAEPWVVEADEVDRGLADFGVPE